LFALFRAVGVWVLILATIVVPHVGQQTQAPAPVETQLSAYDRSSVLSEARAHRVLVAQTAQADAWSNEYSQALDQYQAEQRAEAAAAAEAARVAALYNHPPPPDWIGKIITDAFSPLGQRAVEWAMNVAYCESRYHPNSVNSESGAAGLFQFMPGTWAGSPWHAQSPFDPVANAQAAAWLYSTYGPQRWTCQG
jgi:hypothetical protein